MKKLFVAVAVLSAPIFIATGAWALTVVDDESKGTYYAGGTYTNATGTPTYTHDIDPNDSSSYQWSVTGFTATAASDSQGKSFITVVLSGSYFGTDYAKPDVLTLGAKPGDLYISSNGWVVSNPGVDGHGATDKFNPATEGWNYVVSFGQGTLTKIGSDTYRYNNATLYNLVPYVKDASHPNGYLTTSNVNGAYSFNMYRADQAWQGGYGDIVAGGGSAILYMDGTTANGNQPMLVFSFYNPLGWDPDQLGYHWDMSCGNDVVEGGGTPVPEPGSLLLLGLGLAGLGVYRRKKAGRE